MGSQRIDIAAIAADASGEGTASTDIGAQTGLVVGPAGCSPAQVTIYNSGASTVYGMLFNALLVPADGTSPTDAVQILAKGRAVFTWPCRSTMWPVGCVVTVSSTPVTLTAIASPVAMFTYVLFPDV
jgi:hypothetical protein